MNSNHFSFFLSTALISKVELSDFPVLLQPRPDETNVVPGVILRLSTLLRFWFLRHPASSPAARCQRGWKPHHRCQSFSFSNLWTPFGLPTRNENFSVDDQNFPLRTWINESSREISLCQLVHGFPIRIFQTIFFFHMAPDLILAFFLRAIWKEIKITWLL